MTEVKLDFQKQGGLIPAIILAYTSKEVLMLAYLNEEAYHLTLTSGQMWYWSRSRQELWHKGATSGHYQTVKKITADCDQDTLLIEVDQLGAACHTGAKFCFFHPIWDEEDGKAD